MQDGEETYTNVAATEEVEYTITPPEPPARRLVKLPGAEGERRTIYLVEDGIRYPIAQVGVAVALGLALECVDEDTLLQWPQGDIYTGS